jgi:hypothetical protein
MVEERFHQDELAEILLSMPGVGVQFGAGFLATTGGNMTAFTSANRGLRRSRRGTPGLRPDQRNLHRPRRYNRPLDHVLYISRHGRRRAAADPGRPCPRHTGSTS